MAKKKAKAKARQAPLTAQARTRMMRTTLGSLAGQDAGSRANAAPAGGVPFAAASAAAAAPAADVAVVFTCDNALCIVGIKISGVPPLTFSGHQGINLPSGTRTLGWKVTSSPQGQAFAVTVAGASLDVPIQGVTGPSSGGVRQLTV